MGGDVSASFRKQRAFLPLAVVTIAGTISTARAQELRVTALAPDSPQDLRLAQPISREELERLFELKERRPAPWRKVQRSSRCRGSSAHRRQADRSRGCKCSIRVCPKSSGSGEITRTRMPTTPQRQHTRRASGFQRGSSRFSCRQLQSRGVFHKWRKHLDTTSRCRPVPLMLLRFAATMKSSTINPAVCGFLRRCTSTGRHQWCGSPLRVSHFAKLLAVHHDQGGDPMRGPRTSRMLIRIKSFDLECIEAGFSHKADGCLNPSQMGDRLGHCSAPVAYTISKS